jgi:hypothetical protein
MDINVHMQYCGLCRILMLQLPFHLSTASYSLVHIIQKQNYVFGSILLDNTELLCFKILNKKLVSFLLGFIDVSMA